MSAGLDPNASCETENIQIYDGASVDSRLLGKVCSKSDYVPVFESTSNSLTFQIITSASIFQRTAFAFYYYFSQESHTENCGGYFDALTGSLVSPNYPEAHPEFTYCVWHIQVEKNYKIEVAFEEIFLELDDNCKFDFLAIYDGPSTDSGLIGQVCGLIKPMFTSSSNALTIVLSTDDANSYRGFSASYKAVYAEEVNTTSLTCSSDKMVVILNKSYLESLHYNEDNLQLNDPTCKPRVSNVIEFSIPLHGCGTIKKVEEHAITYTNIITIADSPPSEIITRQKHLQIIVKCEMESNSTVEIMYVTEDNIVQNESASGRYNVSMALFESNAFVTPLPHSPYDVDLNQTLFVQVTLHTPDPNLVVFLDTCTASPSSDFGLPIYDLIRSGCEKDNTSKIYPLLGHYGRFQFNAFKFLGTLGSVYLQCQVLICDSNDSQSRCNRGCVTRQKRDISSYRWKADSVIGPIRLKRTPNPGNPEFRSQADAGETRYQPGNSFHLLSFAVLALNVAIGAGMVMRHYVNRRKGYGYQKLQDC
ncbi:CUB and zona pellucida-like domain-containing protein 1 [Ornithorhynchus anatinus]|uniref:CUB and zona pellucida-like domain-containing protein 1 n=1 Tax=Ornithorhynchus anatinus TaxID=9258 RepID=UPI0019D4BC95|nr:CUB and zona pellucida-like domain-containing protein 1 [Ornithorhynchus anatinus]